MLVLVGLAFVWSLFWELLSCDFETYIESWIGMADWIAGISRGSGDFLYLGYPRGIRSRCK